MRLTTRGKVVVGFVWIVVAWTIAWYAPYWWLKF